jgi:hypothetical protein
MGNRKTRISIVDWLLQKDIHPPVIGVVLSAANSYWYCHTMLSIF